MRIAVPVQDGRLSLHFGRSPAFAFFDVDPATRQINSRTTLPAPPHDLGALAAFIQENGAAVAIAGSMGPGMRHALDRAGITVVLGAPAIDPEEAVRRYLNGTLATAEDPRADGRDGRHHGGGCGHHGRGHGHGGQRDDDRHPEEGR